MLAMDLKTLNMISKPITDLEPTLTNKKKCLHMGPGLTCYWHYCVAFCKDAASALKLLDLKMIYLRPRYTQNEVPFRSSFTGKTKFKIRVQWYTFSEHPEVAHSDDAMLK